jgi:hypothetical protein
LPDTFSGSFTHTCTANKLYVLFESTMLLPCVCPLHVAQAQQIRKRLGAHSPPRLSTDTHATSQQTRAGMMTTKSTSTADAVVSSSVPP